MLNSLANVEPARPLEEQTLHNSDANRRPTSGRPAQLGLLGPPRAPTSTFEALAALSARQPPGAESVFGTLLAGTHPPLRVTGWTPRPLWDEEAMHRAYRLSQLLQLLRVHRTDGEHDWHREHALAAQLTGDLRSLSAPPENQMVPCSIVLQNVLLSLSTLFSPAAGNIELGVNIEPISLPAYRRRALMLAAVELVVNAISHAFQGRGRGRIAVALWRTREDQAQLRVADDGIGHADCSDPLASLAGRLGCLLEGGLSYRDNRAWATVAELVFPLSE